MGVWDFKKWSRKVKILGLIEGVVAWFWFFLRVRVVDPKKWAREKREAPTKVMKATSKNLKVDLKKSPKSWNEYIDLEKSHLNLKNGTDILKGYHDHWKVSQRSFLKNAPRPFYFENAVGTIKNWISIKKE